MISNGLRCRNDGTPLTGKQRMWCSPHCANVGYSKTHRHESAQRVREWRERQRRIKAGIPEPLNDAEQRVVELEAQVLALRASLRRADVR